MLLFYVLMLGEVNFFCVFRFDGKFLMFQPDVGIGSLQSPKLISLSNSLQFDSSFDLQIADVIVQNTKKEVTADLLDYSEITKISQVGLSSSLLLPSLQASGYVSTITSPKFSIKEMLHNQAKSKHLSMPNKKPSLLQTSQYARNGLHTSKVCQIKYPSNVVLTRLPKQRPSSATFTGRQQSILFDHKGTNTVDSYLSQAKYTPSDLMSTNYNSKLGSLTGRQHRPKSSYRPNIVPPVQSNGKTLNNSKVIGFPSRILLSNGVATLSQPVADICIVPEPSLDQIKGILSSKKLKPVYQDITVKSKPIAIRSNGLHKLNLTVKSSGLDCTEQVTHNSNSSSSLHESSGISSACSFCSESLSDCSCKTNSSFAVASDSAKSIHATSLLHSKSFCSTGRKAKKKLKSRPQSSRKDNSSDLSLKLKEISLLEANNIKSNDQVLPSKFERYFCCFIVISFC